MKKSTREDIAAAAVVIVLAVVIFGRLVPAVASYYGFGPRATSSDSANAIPVNNIRPLRMMTFSSRTFINDDVKAAVQAELDKAAPFCVNCNFRMSVLRTSLVVAWSERTGGDAYLQDRFKSAILPLLGEGAVLNDSKSF
jgi:hypothetical protein